MAHQPRPTKIGPYHLIETGNGRGFHAAFQELPRIEEHPIQFRALRREGRHGFIIGVIKRHAEGVWQRLFQRVEPTPHEHQFRAPLGEHPRRRATDSAAGAGDEDALAIKEAHSSPFSGIFTLLGMMTPPLTAQVSA